MSVSDLISAVEHRKKAFAEEVARLAEERRQYEAAASEIDGRRARNGQELAGYLLPDLDDEDLAALERRLRYPALLPEKRVTEAALAELEREREAIEADPRFSEREVRRVDYEEQLAEIAEAAAAFARERELWESSAYFQALHRVGWFEPDYDGGLFDWLRDWRACSLLMAELEERFPDKKFPDDEDVKREWSALYASSEPVLTLKRGLDEKIAELDRIAARHAALLAAPDELFRKLWKTLAGLVVDHLRAAPEELLVELGKADATLATFLKKDVGLGKQADYLRQLVAVRIEPYRRRLAEEERKLSQKADKLRYKRARGKYVIVGPNDVRSMRTLPTEKWSTRRTSFVKTRQRLVEFDRWERGSYVSDFLWWDLVTRGARGDDLAEVQVFHERHPGWSIDAFRDPLETSASDAAAAANDLAAASAVDAMMAQDDTLDVS